MAHFSPVAERVIWNGFGARILRSAVLEVVVVPDLGAKVVSLKNLCTGREWMYHPNNSPNLFRNQPDDDFARSPLTGWDECLPTIAPCTWRGRSLPDHGEVWNTAWQLDEAAWKRGVIKTSVKLPISPFEFTRAIEIQNDALHVNYHLLNLSGEPQEFLWAMHPLLALQTGDRLALSHEIRQHLGQQSWLDSLDFEKNVSSCVKAFAGPLQQGHAEIFNPVSDDSLTFKWDVADCNTLGIWLTRGGWNGHHHVALEPTNGAPDSLAVAAGERNNCGVLVPFGKKEWRIQIRATHHHRSPLLSDSLTGGKWLNTTNREWAG
jgi:galactose mutarotase-like enzyme